ncbi:MAG TPA: L-seryl-tRNA(Sec) selenium transferase [Pyrinomonadaceae bacterium]|nr:L-seryl-tRNA(Sec) selenium transferase [Pyrinomonadaceae bacterium]
MTATKPSTLALLPSIDQVLRTEAATKLRESLGLQHLTALARRVTEEMRSNLKAMPKTDSTRQGLLEEAVERLQSLSDAERRSGIRRVINATGVILHTNLGRAPLSDAARSAISEAAGYCTVEYDTSKGSRGRRARRVEDLLIELTGAEAALVVNNCAAAALLVLTVLAQGAETIVSRGELVEIGGDFRVPDVMANSGTKMIEVGSTNRTRLDDYRQALTNNTRVIMKVHPSNFRITGFTASATLAELSALSNEAGVYLYEDAGSGAFEDLSDFGLGDEPVIRESISAGVDVVSFSGDKLAGASQAGLIAGKKEIIERLREHSLYRALRADKLCLAALEATLEAHLRRAIDEIPTLRMLGISRESIETRATDFANRLADLASLRAIVIPGKSAVGGGSGPNVQPETVLLALKHTSLNADKLEEELRLSSPPVITRIAEDFVLIDLRTVDPREESELFNALLSLSA